MCEKQLLSLQKTVLSAVRRETEITPQRTEEVLLALEDSVSCTNIQRGVAGFSSQTRSPTSNDENEVFKIKVEENMHIKEEDEPVLDSAVKVEYESCADLLRVVPSLCCETCLPSSDDGGEVFKIKLEDVDVQEENVPLPSVTTQAEQENTQNEHQFTLGKDCPCHCDTSNKVSSHQHDVKAHRCTHSGEHPYVCCVCDKAFSYKSNMKAHQRTHSEMEEMLIEKVRQRTFLYDTKSPDYRDQHMRASAWKEIGKELKIKPVTAKDTWEKLRRCFVNALHRRRNKKSGDGAKKMIPWRFDLEMSFLLPSLYAKNTQSDVHNEENLEDVQIDGQETDESEMNIYELPEGQSNITREETSSSFHVDSHNQGYCPTRRKQQGRDSAVVQVVNVSEENLYLRQRRHEEKTTIRNMDETDMFFLSMAKMTKKLPSLEQTKIKLQLSQAVLQAELALEEQQECS